MLVASQAVAARGVLAGLPVSAGRARGRVVVVTSPGQAAAVVPGDVMVIRHACRGCSAAVARVAALVLETGGALCALATVARECRVPAIADVADATTLLADGEIVEIDGGCGTLARCSS